MALSPEQIPARLAGIRERIARAAARAGRSADAVRLVGVAKRMPAELVLAALRAGLRDVGESYVQEALTKLPQVQQELARAGEPAPRLHLVGRLQRNKARDAARLFDVVHSVDRVPLAEELARRAEARGGPLEVLLQVNLAAETQKGGVDPEGLAPLLEACLALPALRCTGLMTLPPAVGDPEQARPYFARLRALRDGLASRAPVLRELSMGMSGDFEIAIEEGATLVRVGTALFGARED